VRGITDATLRRHEDATKSNRSQEFAEEVTGGDGEKEVGGGLKARENGQAKAVVIVKVPSFQDLKCVQKQSTGV